MLNTQKGSRKSGQAISQPADASEDMLDRLLFINEPTESEIPVFTRYGEAATQNRGSCRTRGSSEGPCNTHPCAGTTIHQEAKVQH